MHPPFHIFTLFFAIIHHVYSIASLEYCGDGVQTAVSSFTFAGDTTEDYWANICTNELGIQSLGAGVKTYCSNTEKEPSWELLQGYCSENGLILTDWTAVEGKLTNSLVQGFQVVQFEDIDATKIWNSSILISGPLYSASLRTTEVFAREYMLHQDYGWAIYGFWALTLLVGMTQKAWATFVAEKPFEHSSDLERATSILESAPKAGTLSRWINTNLIIPTAFGTRHQRPRWACTIPTRMETLIVAAFWILNLILCCVTYEIFWPNLYYVPSLQLWRYISDRTGIISYANLPFLWLFAGRNNVFLSLTPYSYSTFNTFHRHVARIATLEALIHSIGYTVMEVSSDDLAVQWQEQYWYTGGIATIAMGLLALPFGLSSLFIRRRAYEIFLLLHIALGVLVIVGLFYHTAIFNGEYDGYLWPLVAIWSFDRLARVARLAYCNVRVFAGAKRIGATRITSTTVCYHQDAHLLELRIIPSGSVKPAAGQHYFVYQRNGWKLWENHPFTLASWSELRDLANGGNDASTGLSKVISKGAAEVKDIAVTSSSSGTSSPTNTPGNCSKEIVAAAPIATVSSSSEEGLTFLVRPYDSWTRRLQTLCQRSTSLDHTITTTLAIEGPYGHRAPLHHFQSVVFVIGGSGITAALPYLQEFLVHHRRPRQASGHSSDNMAIRRTATEKVTLIWSTRQEAMITEVVNRELRSLLTVPEGLARCHFHVTGPEPIADSLRLKTELANASIGPGSGDSTKNHVYVQHSRPDVNALILEAADSSAVGEKVAVFVCGPAGMADGARGAVHTFLKRMDKPMIDVKYFEESFGF